MSSMAQMGAIVVTNSCEIGTGAAVGIIKGSSSSVACSSSSSSSSFRLLTNFSPNRICLKRTTSSCSRVSTSCEDIVKKKSSKALVYVVAAAASSSGSETAGEQEEEGGDAAAGKLEKKKQGTTTTTEWVKLGLSSFVAVGAALVLTTQAAPALAEAAAEDNSAFQTYFGTAASASSYGGYGGNTSKKDSAEYIFDVPQGWKERLISKVEKGTNGTDSEFYNPRRKDEKTYLTYLAGFRKLGPRDNVLNNLALSDVNLQDIISSAESIRAEDKTEGGQLYYVYEIDSPVAHELIKVTCTKNKLYSHFVKAPNSEWNRDEPMLRHLHDSFQTVGSNEPLPIF
ncbi:unnamed protein product [Sphagnum balticum]